MVSSHLIAKFLFFTAVTSLVWVHLVGFYTVGLVEGLTVGDRLCPEWILVQTDMGQRVEVWFLGVWMSFHCPGGFAENIYYIVLYQRPPPPLTSVFMTLFLYFFNTSNLQPCSMIVPFTQNSG